ncbi:hypothetical protein [Sphingomonas oligophenolica]|uniref:Fe-S oxidoreductase n=1 Tax=Sphingomonas oligophenolica TaxID=301154 RepID=A0A502CJ55_9SPHN|nr:hypothetical protein [Sphingomonas oligophenolica]TPG12099.1 hypothetical protein EAH84_10095 [Sphingomonas oligophenolica]
MKFILLAATALFAAPLAAQTMPTTPDQSTMPAQQPTTDPMPGSSDPTPAQNQAMQNNSMAPSSMASEPTSGSMQGSTMTPGGYQPSAPAMSGTMTPGVTPVYRPAPTPDQAYPAPAPLAKYPLCKKGQYDKCMQPGGR